MQREIIILGGGTAGWITATLLEKHWRDKQVQITLVESSQIGVIGVGEGSTPHLKQFFNDIDVAESEWMPKCNATYKNGIRFDNWSTKPGFENYFHPFASKIDAFSAPVFLYNNMLRRKGINIHAHPDRYYLAATLAKENKAPINAENFPFEVGYGYHFDAVLLSQFLKSLALSRGINQIDAKVTDVNQHASGDISSLVLDNGEVITGDLFFDCSGFNGLLINKTLNVPFISFSNNLFCDNAVAIQSPPDANIGSQTVSQAMDHGWAWEIPLTNRIGNGYVYSSKYCTNDEAETELRRKLNLLDSDVKARHIKMNVGRRAEHWHKNTVAVGLSQGFIEPLEATAIVFIIETVKAFLKQHSGNESMVKQQQSFNAEINRRFEGVRNYIVAHYRLNSRNDTDFWRDNANNSHLSNELVDIINNWLRGNDLTKTIEQSGTSAYYPPFSWNCILAGYGVFPEQQQLTAGDPNLRKYDLVEIDDFIRRSALNFPKHNEYLQKHRPDLTNE